MKLAESHLVTVTILQSSISTTLKVPKLTFIYIYTDIMSIY